MSERKIVVERTTDYYDCETCGSSYAEGARVTLDGEPLLTLEPVAHCYDGQSFDDEKVARAILEALGFSVQWRTDA